MLYARWDKGATSRTLVLQFHATRQEVIKKDFPTKQATWNPQDYALYLAPTSLGPIDGEVQALAEKSFHLQTIICLQDANGFRRYFFNLLLPQGPSAYNRKRTAISAVLFY
nr:hypothetical protein [uncultured Desulfobulbus sp.]